ncbi:CAP domain-containing protein [Tabrizicola piscis]|nr:CAP domain-containing protein [Tabrizicola piscis]
MMDLRTTLTALATSLAVSLAAPAIACTVPGNASAMQAEVLSHLNAERRANGLAPLRLSNKLDKAAQGHACDNAKRMSISHVSSDGGTLKNRLRRAGYSFRTAAENTGRGFASGARAVQWWMNSSKHRDNILLRKAKEVGIGIAVSPAPDNKLHWILVVGASK